MPDIFSAAINGDAGRVASLLSEDPKLVHAVNQRQRTALHYAPARATPRSCAPCWSPAPIPTA